MTTTHEAVGVETLDLQPAYTHDWNEREYVRIGVPSPGDLTLIVLVHFQKNGGMGAIRVALAVEEVDAVIEGLQEAKRRVHANTIT